MGVWERRRSNDEVIGLLGDLPSQEQMQPRAHVTPWFLFQALNPCVGSEPSLFLVTQQTSWPEPMFSLTVGGWGAQLWRIRERPLKCKCLGLKNSKAQEGTGRQTMCIILEASVAGSWGRGCRQYIFGERGEEGRGLWVNSRGELRDDRMQVGVSLSLLSISLVTWDNLDKAHNSSPDSLTPRVWQMSPLAKGVFCLSQRWLIVTHGVSLF